MIIILIIIVIIVIFLLFYKAYVSKFNGHIYFVHLESNFKQVEVPPGFDDVSIVNTNNDNSEDKIKDHLEEEEEVDSAIDKEVVDSDNNAAINRDFYEEENLDNDFQ